MAELIPAHVGAGGRQAAGGPRPAEYKPLAARILEEASLPRPLRSSEAPGVVGEEGEEEGEGERAGMGRGGGGGGGGCTNTASEVGVTKPSNVPRGLLI